MEKIYLGCLVVGFIFLAVSIFLDMDGDADIDLETDMVLDGSSVSGEGPLEAIKFLTIRNLIFFVAFFGLTGSVITYLYSNSLITIISSIFMGLFASIVGHKLFKYLKGSEVGEGINMSVIIGQKAKVLVGMTKLKPGKISAQARDQIVQVLAYVAEESGKEHFFTDDEVIVVKVENGIAYVGEKGFIK